MLKKSIGFLKSVKLEMANVSWPTKDDLKEGTTVVIIMSAIVAVFLSLIDAAFSFLIRNLLLQG